MWRWGWTCCCPTQVEKELASASQKLFGKTTLVRDVEDCGEHLGWSLLQLCIWALP